MDAPETSVRHDEHLIARLRFGGNRDDLDKITVLHFQLRQLEKSADDLWPIYM